MRRHTSFVLVSCLVGAALLTLSGCAAPANGSTLVPGGKPLQASADVRANKDLVGSIDDFGVDLLKFTSQAERPGGNVIVSPVSVHAALSMTANGATDDTAKEMRSVLYTDSMTPAETNQRWAVLLAGLGARDASQTLEIANSLWANKGIAFKQPFLNADRDSFGAQISTLDFTKDDVAGAINSWVSRNTHGMIPNIVDRVPGSAVLYLANAVYFKGDWATPFEHERTHTWAFTRSDGTDVDVDMMRTTGQLPYAQNRALQATKLPYMGLDTAFYVMLPKPGVSLDEAMASLEGTGFSDLRSTMMSPNTTEVALGLPKIDAEFSTELSQPLTAMGMPRAFDAAQAQFPDMADLGSGQPIYIGRVLHKTKVKVDEKGTEAAAATVVEMVPGAALPAAAPPQIICDRPYLFAIVDQKSGVMLFLGAVNDPTK
jgi:serine protease inhibitor